MTFKELVNKVRNLVLEAKNVTIEDTENLFESDNVEGALKEIMIEINGEKTKGIKAFNKLVDIL
ncbi:MAG: hypothetical protein E6029_04000 [Clostridioides difficile]|jgi:hypothetical protein|uniref:hypothetical protein n=1 Tax=Clostridia TaxID=186801 RepID=UPI00038C9CEB|nr:MULTISPECIES: hypothetical protein [Clostridia]DAL33929.1 MAG TPA_asm: hypothetical protein [Caudoviricetes sp.]HDN2470523.1 hypothetical protein [Clostridioides difficile CD196]EGT4059232.1 hypothetical protein [Clostridioides difficile]EGT4170859.1 hypothetical protein [Clostridioides difficile]EGT4540039.1 hypothetical protein [Clostridioides difficile]